ncbi:hypothetical protein [Dactylosporangium sp. NPDC051541]|uniref:hypothetical protein n=1 Tax=Dactylosporangium sp. NPDC051541 TaxID=3363977 RepID=UPI00379ECCB8
MTAHSLRAAHGRWVYGGAALHTRGVSMRRGVLRTAAGDFDLEPVGRHRLGAVARIDGRPVVALQLDGCRVPGPGGPARWSVGRHSATLTRDGARIEVRAGRPGGPLRVEVTGAWAEEELVVLTACFAVLSRRRQRLIVMAAVVTAGARGPS